MEGQFDISTKQSPLQVFRWKPHDSNPPQLGETSSYFKLLYEAAWVSFFFVCVHVREDDKHSLDIHDNPPAPDNVVKEDGDTVSGRTMSTPHC